MAKKKETTKKAEAPKERVFNYEGIKLNDPDKEMSTKEVCEFYSATYPALTNASIKGPVTNNGVASYELKPRTGTMG